MADTMTRQEMFEFIGEYTTDQEHITLLFLELGEDPEADDYPVDAIAEAEKFFKTLGIARQKAIAASGSSLTAQNSQSITNQTYAIAAELLEEQDITIPLDVLRVIVAGAVQQSVAQADAIADLSDKAFVAQLERREKQRTNALLKSLDRQAAASQQVLSNEAGQRMIDALIQPYEPELKVEDFLAETKARIERSRQAEAAKQQRVKEYRASQTEFNMQAWLEEVGIA